MKQIFKAGLWVLGLLGISSLLLFLAIGFLGGPNLKTIQEKRVSQELNYQLSSDGTKKIRMVRQLNSEMEKLMDIEVRQGIDEKMRESDLQNLETEKTESDGHKPTKDFSFLSHQKISNSERRLLATENILETPGIITFDGQESSTKEYYAYTYIFSRLKKFSSQFIVYPYEFSFTPNGTTESKNCSRGAVFSRSPKDLPTDETSSSFFRSLTAGGNISFGKAKALYDINIAIFQVEAYYDEIYKDLTYESSNYCNLLSTYLGKFSECMSSSAYYSFKNDTSNAGKTALVMVTAKDIANGFLQAIDGGLRFPLLIIPDYYLGADGIIKSELGGTGISKVKTYLQNGGFVIASGKAGYLLETWDLLPEGLYDTDQLLTSTHSVLRESIEGCNAADEDYDYRLLCMNLTDDLNSTKSYLLSAFMMNPEKLSGMKQILNYTTSATLKKKNMKGLISEMTEVEKSNLPYAVLAEVEKGKIYLINGNPLYKSGYYTMIYNLLFLAMSKKWVMDISVGTPDNQPIPGGEAGIKLDLSLTFMNLYDSDIKSLETHLYLPDRVVPPELPSSCSQSSEDLSNFVNLTNVNISSHIVCTQTTVGSFEKYEVKVNLEILNSTVTQAMTDILIAQPYIRYTDSSNNVTSQYEMDPIRTDAALAAHLRGTFNVDPPGYFPLTGPGIYFDNVLNVENKENTDALEVEYIGIVPLITPIMDNSDQKNPVKMIRFLPRYYRNEYWNYTYPFTKSEGENYDYLDYKWLAGKGVVQVAEWDIPVKMGKVVRDSTFPDIEAEGDINKIRNLNLTLSIASPNIALKQIYYVDADKFFEHAAQRLMVFVDTSTPEGAAALYPNGIPENEKNPNHITKCKKEIGWVRGDIYFYTASEYQFPNNINSTHVISMDRYPKDTGECASVFGDAKSKLAVEGYFSSDKEDGLKANEYYNKMLMYCGRSQVTYDDIETVSNGSIKKMHYLIPIIDNEVQTANDVMYFVAHENGTGYLEGYPEVKFIFAHTVNFSLDSSISRQGARLELILPEGVTFTDGDSVDITQKVSYTADQVAFYNTTYDSSTRTIHCYFKRGLMPNEAYGKASKLEINVEGLSSTTDLSATLRIYEMKYDISKPEKEYEAYTFIEDRTITLQWDRFYSMPSVELHFKLQRRGFGNIMSYELLDPYTRYGVYYQELLKHRYVWVSVETHHTTKPGLTTINGAYAFNSHIGICSVPFAEYVTTGQSLLIPSSASTSRIEWFDIWGRKWRQPLRSTFPDIPPLPGPLRSFVMTTTFELTKSGTTERVLDWSSDEKLDIRVHLKLLNNYPKYFAITTCKDNELQFFNHKVVPGRMVEYDMPPYDYDIDSTTASGNNYHISIGNRAVYGMCFDEEGTILEGSLVSAENRNRIATAYLCAATLNQTKLMECAEQLSDLPTVRRRQSGDTREWWMYSPEVDRYYPSNYIKPNMWDMTHETYDDNCMCKAFRYHFDNNLPSLDPGPFGNPALIKPHNIIAQPIWKGFGYDISYSKTKTLARFPAYKGWWSDNLQNKDHTLLAGQSSSNDISVDKSTLLPDSMWINAKNIQNPVNSNIIPQRLRNIHTCLYNQHRVKQTVDSERMFYLPNVVQNNVIPIIPDLDEDDARYTSYDCSGVYQYSPYNISQVDNVLRTPTIRDWLYFAANLRGNALETINIPYTLAPLAQTKVEGMAKIADGGRFVYWNPALGPNCYVIVDDPVNIVEAIRNDLTITSEVFPSTTTTFKPEIYHLFTIEDPEEKLRRWTYTTYTNNYGFGDATVATFVGGTQSTVSLLEAGEYTLVKISFYNNAGFDWNMFGRAIDFEYVGTQAINADDLLNNKKHTIQSPLSYNFMILSIPDEIKNYIEIGPSNHNIDVAPQYFDFMNINVVTIRDGFRGDYFYRINMSDTLPDSIRGKVWTINITLNESCFESLPGYNDPTGSYHDYKLQIPPIKIAIPYASGAYAGKAYYTSGYSSGLNITAQIPKLWNVIGARYLTDAQLTNIRLASANLDTVKNETNTIWNSLDTTRNFPIKLVEGSSQNTLTVDLSQSYPVFPLPNGNDPDITSFKILVKCNSSQLDYGTIRVITSPTIKYYDHKGKSKSAVIPAPVYKTVMSKGAWLKISYSYTIVKNDSNGNFVEASDQRFFAEDKNGYVKLTITTKNVGTATAYYVKLSAVLAEGISVVKEKMPPGIAYTLTPVDSDTNLTMTTGRTFAAGGSYGEEIYLKFSKLANRRLLASKTSFTVIKSVSAGIDLTATEGSVSVIQTINTPLKFSVITDDRESVSLNVAVNYTNIFPTFTLVALASPTTTTSGKPVRYKFYRTILSLNCESGSTATGDCSTITTAETVISAISLTRNITDTPIPINFAGFIYSAKYLYKVETYDESKTLIASATWTDSNVNEENSEEGSAIPLWAIILIPAAAIAVILIAGILLYRRYRVVKIVPDVSAQNIVLDYNNAEIPDPEKV